MSFDKDTWNDALGQVIKREREAMGIAQAKFSKNLGFGEHTIGAIERGQRSCYMETLYTIATEGFGLSVSDLVLATEREIKRS